ncbi:hypothetical protein [Methylovorus glucosotrophus]|uniref:Uncharacterized protein n=1 Tax=Methylovorus glucosotrophus (strain SIP3-4) TaxID=582744 RepID=C6X802_METGS|nr:hypothetical protein [Methylovorus glucosotrophus]ACT51329.1 hypothetical protein Msip34_2087 [Methylovorus glucosotrophus SIP3-4]
MSLEQENQFFKTRKEIDGWVYSNYSHNPKYTINDDLTVDWVGNLDISNLELKQIPIQFNKVSGDFRCSDNQLTSLKGCPLELGGNFDCSYNQLNSLEYAPIRIDGEFDCSYNKITTLQNSPREIRADFDCNDNQLTSLKFAPVKIGGGLFVQRNQIKDLEHVDIKTGDGIYCRENPFINNIYNELDPEEIKPYFESEKLANKLQAELPKQDDFRTIIDSKQIQDLHAQILERNKTVEIPDTYITEANKPKEDVKVIQNNEVVHQTVAPVQEIKPRRMKL